MKNNISTIFNEAGTERTYHPLFKGMYKIRDARLRFQRFEETLSNIKKHNSGTSKPESESNSLGGCVGTVRDQNTWLNPLPSNLIHIFGHDLVPAINALHGDGLSQADIVRLNSVYRPRIDAMIDELVCNPSLRHRGKNIVSKAQVRALTDIVGRGGSLIDDITQDVSRLKSSTCQSGH